MLCTMKTALAILVALASLSCVTEMAQQEPQRPESVSSAANWIGGPDGGVWVELQPDPDRAGIYQATITHETGAVAYQGPLRRQPAADSPIDPSLIDGWDGDELLLMDGGSLRAVE